MLIVYQTSIYLKKKKIVSNIQYSNNLWEKDGSYTEALPYIGIQYTWI